MKIGSSPKSNFYILGNISISRIFLSIILSFPALISCSKSDLGDLHQLDGTTMGTFYSIKIVADNNKINLPIIKSEIDSVLIFVNNQMSTYIKTSEISLFNTHKDTTWFNVSSDLSNLIYEAKKVSEETNGMYDITIGPLVNLWGFGPANYSLTIPSDEQIFNAKTFTGTEKIEVDINTSRIRKLIPEIYCDLSSIAKGFGVDKVGLLLEKNGFNNYMVEIGGEVRTKGLNSKSQNWLIGISSPTLNGLQRIVALSGISIATSGDYLSYREIDGKRYSHLLDPSTGKPIIHNLASVSVLHDNCSIADAYATAINVMGPEIGYNFAFEKELPIFMIVRENNMFVEKYTTQFLDYLVERK